MKARLLWIVLSVAGCSSRPSTEPPAPIPPPAADAVCNPDRWCWEVPRMGGNTLRAATAIARDDLWAVGDHGTILHGDGDAWRPVASPTTGDLAGIWAASAQDLWAVGSDGSAPVVLRGDGKGWRVVELPDLELDPAAYDGVWGSGPDDVWIVGHAGAILHWDGTAFRESPSGVDHYLHAVWGTAADDVIAVGDAGAVVRWDGTAWTRIWSHTYDLTGIRDGWITGDNSMVLRRNGKTLEEVHYDSEGSVLGAPLEVDGTLWIPQTSYDRPMRRVGDRFEDVDELAGHDVEAFVGVANDDLWAIGVAGLIAHRDGKGWTIVHADEAPTSIAIGDAVWAIDYHAVRRRDAEGWRELRKDEGFGPAFALGAHLWIPRQGTLVHWDGRRWREEDLSAAAWPSEVWASAPDDVWATAMSGTVHHFDGKRWSSEVVDPEERTLGAIWGSGPDDLWVDGGYGALHHRDARGWTRVATGVEDVVEMLHGTGPDDVWAATGNVVLHWDGKAWTRSLEQALGGFRAVHAVSRDEVYVGDLRGGIHRWDGAAWRREETGTGCDIRAIAGGGDSLWIATECGVLRRLRR